VQVDHHFASRQPSARPIRVAHVALSFEMGGAEKLLVEFARRMDRERFELHFVALTRDGVISQQLRDLGCPVTVLQGPDGLRVDLVLRLTQFFRRERFDIVHTHLDRPLIYGTVAARLARIRRVIHTRHGQSDDLSPRQRRLVRLVARWIDHFVCVSQDAAQRTAVDHGVPGHRIRTIWNGVDLAQFTPVPLDRAGPAVTVARLIPEKDIGTLLQATALAARQDDQFRVEIAGDGPCRDELTQLARQMGIDQRVTFLGAVHQVPELLSRASMFILPSRTEGIALAVLEAQARSLPVIATRVGGNAEIIADGENGLLVPAGDAHGLAQAILRLRGDEQLGRRLGQAGRSRMESQFDVQGMIGRYESLYDMLMRQAES
jgi:glycosyltransferase involved in cell wall biosynthesis